LKLSRLLIGNTYPGHRWRIDSYRRSFWSYESWNFSNTWRRRT
jgi:hypothetical protein